MDEGKSRIGKENREDSVTWTEEFDATRTASKEQKFGSWVLYVFGRVCMRFDGCFLLDPKNFLDPKMCLFFDEEQTSRQHFEEILPKGHPKLLFGRTKNKNRM